MHFRTRATLLTRTRQIDLHHMQTYSPHVHAKVMNCDRPLEKEMLIWSMKTARVRENQKVLRHKNTISIWHPPNRDLLQTLFGGKSSRTGSELYVTCDLQLQ